MLSSSNSNLAQPPSGTEPELPEHLQRFLSVVGVVNYSNAMPHTTRTPRHSAMENSRRDDSVDCMKEDEDIFESALDLSDERLRYFFQIFDTDHDGRISYDALRRGLEFHAREDTSSLDEMSFELLVKHLDLDESGDISFEEFTEGLRLLMLRALFHTSFNTLSSNGRLSTIEIFDYNPSRLERRVVQDWPHSGEEYAKLISKSSSSISGSKPENMKRTDLYFKTRPDWIKTRWINIVPTSVEATSLTMRRLAVKYSLHPLALEDALDPRVKKPKAEVFSNHYFIMLPLMHFERSQVLAKAEPSTTVRYYRSFIDAMRTCFGRDNYTFNNKSTEMGTSLMRQPKVNVHMVSLFVNVPQSDTIITFPNFGSEVEKPNRGDHWLRVQKELEKGYSKLRQYDAQYLTYALLDQAVDLVCPVTDALRSEIRVQADHLRQVKFSDSLERIHAVRHELEKVCRKLKPFLRLLTHVIEDDIISPGVTVYLKDVLDNLENQDDELRELIVECHALDDEADKQQARQMDTTLYTLTIVSTVFLPAQFLTGVWGMNFENMPELSKAWGYPMFWGLTATMAFLLLVLFNFGSRRQWH